MRKLLFIIFCAMTLQNVSAQTQIKVRSLKELVTDLAARTNVRNDLNDSPCALIKVQYPFPDVVFEGNVVGSTDFKHNEYWVYVPDGTKRLKIHIPGHPTLTVEFADFLIPSAKKNVTYSMDFDIPDYSDKHKFIKKNSLYIGAGGSYSSGIGASFLAGATIFNVNIEAGYILDFSESKPVGWYSNNDHFLTEIDTYKVNCFFAKIGYQIPISKNFALIPQAGYLAQILKSSGQRGDAAVCGNVTVGAKVLIPVAKNVRFFASPEYAVPIQKSETYTNIVKIASLNEGGFYATAGLMVNF